MSEYRTTEDILKEASDAYCKLGRLMDELTRLMKGGRKDDNKK